MPHSCRLKLLTGCLALCCATLVSAQDAAAPSARVMSVIETRCALCHGQQGESASAVYPRLAAQNITYMTKQLQDFRDGRRPSDTMAGMVKDLSDADIQALSQWFSSRKPVSRRASNPDLAAVGKYIFEYGNSFSGVPSCTTCHGGDGHGTQTLPRLAGQHPTYLETQLREFGKRSRTNDNEVMHSVASKLTELESRAVSVYLGTLQ